MTSTKDIENLAEKVKKMLNLKYDEASVKFMEGFIERNKIQFQTEEDEGLINSCAAFLGQCIIKNYGGRWEKDNQGYTVIVFNERNQVNPHAKTRKQFENGIEDSVYSLYQAIPIVFKDYVKFKKKEWWQIK